MLDSFNKALASVRTTNASGFLSDDASPGRTESSQYNGLPAQQGFLTRLFVRRWLILLFAIIIFAISVFYRLPWQAEAVALLVFSLGAALIPRSGLSIQIASAIDSYAKPSPIQLVNGLINALPTPCVLLSRDGIIVSFNDKAIELFSGLRTGLHISAATRNPQVLEAVMDCCPDKPLQNVMFSERVPVERHMDATVSWLNTPTAFQAPSILLYLRDLTEQRRLDQLRADFIANASHEIKTPLASLLGFIETLQGAARNDEAARDRFLSIMAKQAERMARLIENLMSLSRIEMRAHLKPQEIVPIPELLAQVCEALEPMAAEAKIKVSIESELHEAAVIGDRDELTQVFINLIHNAIKYGRPGGSVLARLERRVQGAGPLVAVTIEDDGPGIPSQHLPRLTERFYRVSDSGALEKGGTGLGLAIVKHVLNRHRGELRICSVEGVGSKFTVLLAEHSLSSSLSPPVRDSAGTGFQTYG